MLSKAIRTHIDGLIEDLVEDIEERDKAIR